MRFGLSAVFFGALLLPVAAGAQSLGGLGGGIISEAPFTLSVTPQYPSPYGQAYVSVYSNSLNLANATLTVSVNGQQTYSGSVHAFPVQLGAAGTVTDVRATLSSAGMTYLQILPVQPEDVALIAEPISSSPPMYPGKSLPPLDGNVRFVAVANLRSANGKASSPATYAYSWTVDGVQMSDSSGIGKSSIIVPAPLEYRNSEVSVTVTDATGSILGGDSLSYSALPPSMRIYENDPLLGLRYAHALSGNYTINGTESTLYAAPFSLPITNGAPLVQWFLNGSAVQTGTSVTLRPTGSGQGSANLSAVASGDQSTTASTNLSLIFGASPSTNFFGL